METTTSDKSSEPCNSCYGQGVTATEHGPLTCSDCAGVGSLPSNMVRTEWRLRELERIYSAADSGISSVDTGAAAQDLRWLVSEVRRARGALLQILAVTDDTDLVADPTLTRIKFLANEVLSIYPLTRSS
jgi:hypothetical protein